MKILKLLSVSLSDVMNVVAIMSGISSLVFSGITWMNTEVAKKDIARHHNILENRMPNISDLRHYRNVSENSFRSLDRDIEKIFLELEKLTKGKKKLRV